MIKTILSTTLIFSLGLMACKKKENKDNTTSSATNPQLIFKFKFDSTQTRLDNRGNVATIPAGHGAQSPNFHSISAHYLELAPTTNTLLGQGEILYKGAETTAGGDTAVNFNVSTVVGEGEVFKSIPLSTITPGTYEWIRTSLTYQNYDIEVKANNGTIYTGNLASFVGYNTYITNYTVGGETITVNDDKLQGYWAFKVANIPYPAITGQAPAGATTVPNPMWQTSPIPQGSCVVTGQFTQPLTITGNETSDITITLSVSTNNSFEWKDQAGDNIYEPSANDTVVDMGLRGLIPIIE